MSAVPASQAPASPGPNEHRPEDLFGPLNEVERKNAPPTLFAAGDLGLLRLGARVSIIGTRKPTPGGIQRASQLAKALVGRAVIVVSGLAEGIDTAAHQGALKHKGRTIAVLGTPLDQTYPKSNTELQTAIIRGHLALSQFAPGTPARPANFPMRNRTMALISHATVIVEAGEGSGTIHQGWEAIRLGRPLFLMESLLGNKALKWPEEMRSYGAQVLTRESLDTLFEQLPMEPFRAELIC